MNMRYALMAMSILLGSATPAAGQVSIGISVPGVSIGIYQPVYPELVLVPGYPVYYAPRLKSNYFFYDGLYWVYYGDNWYASSWYNGPWELVDPYYVPLFVLRVPVRYYRAPPVYFRGWHLEAPPRWGHHWGPQWEQRRHGWDRWDRRAAPPPAPPPVYQRQYAGDRYPRAEQQHVLRNQHYRYQPREALVRQRYQEQAASSQTRPQGDPPGSRAHPSQREREEARGRAPVQERQPRPDAERRAPGPREREEVQRPVPPRAVPQQRSPAVREQGEPPRQEAERRAQQAPKPQVQPREPQGRGEPPQTRGNPERRQGPGKERGEEKGPGRQ
jgi:hypothetical protein